MKIFRYLIPLLFMAGNAHALSITQNGNSQSVSSGSVSGNYFSVGTASLTVNGGIVSASTQPYASLFRNAALTVGNSTATAIFWDSVVDEVRDAMWTTATSSDAITIPGNAGGLYNVSCQIALPLAAAGRGITEIWKNGNTSTGTRIIQNENDATATLGGGEITVNASKIVRLNSGDTLRCFLFQSSGSGLAITVGQIYETYFTVTKIW